MELYKRYNKIIAQDIEKAVLGAIISDEKLILKAKEELVSSNSFAIEENAQLYKGMLELYKSEDVIDIVSVTNYCKENNINYSVSELTNLTCSTIPSNFKSYVKKLKETEYKRNLIFKLNNTLEFIADSDLEAIQEELQLIAEQSQDGFEVDSFIQNIADVKRVNTLGGLSTGFKSLDAILGQLAYGTLTILTGEPTAGKSTILNQMIAQVIADGEKALIYSGELTNFNVLQWFMRTVANENDLKEFKGHQGISYYDVTGHGENLIRKWVSNKLFIYKENLTANVEKLTTAIEYAISKKSVKLVLVDNLMTVEGGFDELDKQKILARKLKNIAKKYNACVILVAHPKKRQGGDRSYHMHDVSGASEVVNLADYELMLVRRQVEGSSDVTELLVLKNRITGKQGVKVSFNFDTVRKRFWTDTEELYKNYKYDNVDQVQFKKLKEAPKDVPF